jgi:hypothetical protein
MRHRYASIVALFTFLLMIGSFTHAQEPGRPKTPADQPNKPKTFPSDAIIVVSENLQQALSAMPAGSVILSPKQYQELMERINRLERERSRAPSAMLLSVCRIRGKVVRPTPPAPEGDMAELRLELEFRTDAPNAVVPVPVKGARLVKATLDGETPVWGPDSENLSVLIKEPRVCILKLDLLAPVMQSGAERKIVLDKVPTAAVTSLALTVSETVRSAAVKGSGPVAVERGTAGADSNLNAEALGMLSRLELTWQVEVPETPLPPQLEVVGEQRSTVETAHTETVTVLRFKVRQGRMSQCRLRLPADLQDLRVEQLRDGGESRPEAWRGSLTKAEESYLLAVPQPLTANDMPLTLRLCWRQKTPTQPAVALLLAPIEVIEPGESLSSGTIQVSVASELRPRLLPVGLARMEPRPEDLTSSGAVFAYRYGQPSARLEVFTEPAPLLPSLAEVQLAHQLRISEQALQLTTEIDVLRTARLGVQEIDVQWPAGWEFSRSMLFTSPQVTGTEHDPVTGILRLRLTGRPAGPFKLKLSGKLLAPTLQRAEFLLPHVKQLVGENSGRAETAQLQQREATVVIEAENLEARLEPGTSGLSGTVQPAADIPLPLRGTTSFAATAEPARLKLSWNKRRPVVPSRADLYLHASALQLRQQFQFAARLALPPTLEFLAPRSLLPFLRITVSGKNAEGKTACHLVAFKERRGMGFETDVEVSFPLPANLRGDLTVQAEYLLPRPSATQPEQIRVDLLRPRPTLLAVAEPVEVRCWCGAALRLACQADGWSTAKLTTLPDTHVPPSLELQAVGWEKPLTLTVQPVAEDPLPDVNAERVLVEVRPMPDDRLAYRVRLRLTQVRAARLRLLLDAEPGEVLLENAYAHRQAIPVDQWQMEAAGPGRTRLTLPVTPRWLSQSILLELRFQVNRPTQSWLTLRQQAPGISLEGRARQGTTRWRWEAPAGALLLWHSSALRPEQDWHWFGWAVPPAPSSLGGEMGTWIDPDGEAARLPDLPAYGFTQAARGGQLTVVQVPPLLWCGAGSLLVLTLGWLAWQRMLATRWLWGGAAAALLLLLAFGSETLLLALAFAIQPGLVVLGGLILFHWLRQQRWKRQIVMLPGFTRLPAMTVTTHTSALIAAPVTGGERTA